MVKYIPRYLERGIKEDLQKKMVFIAGPRQCGKTTLAKNGILVTTAEKFLEKLS